MWKSPGKRCDCCCCDGPVRSTWPDTLNVTGTFSGSPLAGCFGSPVSFALKRLECPVVWLTHSGSDVVCEYVSGEVDVGPCPAVRFGLSGSLLWMKQGDAGAVAYRMNEAAGVIKKTNAIAGPGPQVNVYLLDELGSPLTGIVRPITDGWATIAAAIVSNGLATACEVFWPESFANGWDAATIAATLAIDTTTLAFSSSNATGASPASGNTVLGITALSRFVGGEAKWYPAHNTFTPTQTVAYPSLYGFAVPYSEYPSPAVLSVGSAVYFTPTAPSFFHGSVPFAAIVRKRVTTQNGASFLTGLQLSATILAPTAAALHPKPFPEASGPTPCSDCATRIITPTTPTKNGVLVSGFNTASRAEPLTDCPACGGDSGTPAERNTLGATYDKRLIVSAAMESMTVNREWRLTLPDPPHSTFTLTINGQTTAAIANNASASTIRTTLEALSNVAAGDVVCTGGPLPAEVLLTWQASFDTPTAITFTGNAGIVLTAMKRRDDVARFTSDDPVDTNYAGTAHLTHTKTTAVLTIPPADPKFVTVKDDDPEPPLLFPDGANLVLSNCEKRYRNIPYEKVQGLVSGITLASGVTTGLDSPLGNGPIVVSGGGAAPLTSLVVGTPGLTCNLTLPGGPLSGQKYLTTPSGSTSRSMRLVEDVLLTQLEPPANLVRAIETLTFHTDSDLRLLSLRVGCPGHVGEYTRLTWSPVPGSWNHGQYIHGVAGPHPDLSEAMRAWVQNECDGKSCTPTLYDRTLNSPVLSFVGTNPADDPFVASSGTREGAYTDLTYGQYEIREQRVITNPCNGVVECQVDYWVKYVRRDKVEFHLNWTAPADFDGSVQTIDFDEKWFFEYGFIESRQAIFRANVSTDFALRPNIDKTRVITLAFVSDSAIPFIQGELCNLSVGQYGDGSIGSRAMILGKHLDEQLFNFGGEYNSGGFGYYCRAEMIPNGASVYDMPTSGQWADVVSRIKRYSEYCDSVGMTAGASVTNPDGTTSTINSRSEFYGPLPDPNGIATPSLIDFSTATVAVSVAQLVGAHSVTGCSASFRYTLPSSFPTAWAGEHTLLADANEPHWVEESSAAPFVKAMLSPRDWTLTLFEADCSEPLTTQLVGGTSVYSGPTASGRREPRRVVARYRLPCNQRQRFDGNGKNKFELISGDKSVANWPATLTIEP